MKRSTVLGSLVAFCVVIVAGLAAATAAGLIHLEGVRPPLEILFVSLGGMVVVGLLLLWIGIGVYVYRDARERGMEPVLWTLVAMLIPYFVGLVVYLIVRQSRATTCAQCGRGVPADAAFCLHCGASLQVGCPACGRPVAAGAAFCPSCGTRLAGSDGAPLGG